MWWCIDIKNTTRLLQSNPITPLHGSDGVAVTQYSACLSRLPELIMWHSPLSYLKTKIGCWYFSFEMHVSILRFDVFVKYHWTQSASPNRSLHFYHHRTAVKKRNCNRFVVLCIYIGWRQRDFLDKPFFSFVWASVRSDVTVNLTGWPGSIFTNHHTL